MGNPSILIAFFLAIGSTLPGQAISCSEGWKTIPGSNNCYLFSKELGLPIRARGEANAYCNLHGGFLASAGRRAANEFDPLITYIKKNGHDYTWVGATKRVDGTWRWLADSRHFLSVDSNLWRKDEPNGDGVCVEVSFGSLNDISCSVTRAFVCEKNK